MTGITEKDPTEVLELVIQNDLSNPLTLDPVSEPLTKKYNNHIKTIVETRILATRPIQASTHEAPATSIVNNNTITYNNSSYSSYNTATYNTAIYKNRYKNMYKNSTGINENPISIQSTKNEVERLPLIIPSLTENIPHKLTTRKCYLANTSFSTTEEVNNFIETLQSKGAVFKNFYTKNILGLSFCLDIPEGIRFVNEKFSMISIEDDSVFTLGSIFTAHKWSDDLHKSGMALFEAFSEKAISLMQNLRKTNKSNGRTDEKSDSSIVPRHFFKMMNMGNLLFNNYLLDNLLSRLLGISYLSRWIYNWEGGNAGNGVVIVALGTPKCTNNRKITESLLSDKYNSLSGNATVRFIDLIDCRGMIKLSKLLKALEDIGKADILLIPVTGPHSDLLNAAIKRLGRKVTIISAAGDDGIEACNTSPGGKEIIKVGSLTKYGNLSTFSNNGPCVNFYALGEEVLKESGTSYSAAIVTSALAAYKEKFPTAENWQIQSFMRINSAKNQEGQLVFKLPYDFEAKEPPIFYAGYLVFIFSTLILCVTGILIYAIYRMIVRIRMKKADEKYLDKDATPMMNSNPSLRQKKA
ncbi:Proprotein convertase subtilisin/kexin type 9 [Glugoides intestinalis]